MKKVYFTILFVLAIQGIHAQQTSPNWKITGNSDVKGPNFLGTTNGSDLVFKTNNTEHGRLTAAGIWRFGTANNYVQIDALGKLKVGAYLFPSTDGLNGQVLKTNGAGVLAWSNDASGIYTAGTGISISGNAISNTGDLDGTDDANRFLSNLSSPTAINQSLLPDENNTRDFGSAALSWKHIYSNGALYLNGEKFLWNPGNGNTALGPQALSLNTTGHQNIAIGTQALGVNTTGFWNTATGFQALSLNTTGFRNTASGYQALRDNITSSDNTAVGFWALANTTGSENTAVGSGALFNNNTGSSNSALGVEALRTNTTGSANTAMGNAALISNSTGSRNTAIGNSSLSNNTTGTHNVAQGNEALRENTTGSSNTVIGSFAFTQNSTGNNLTAIGFAARVSADGLTNATAIGSGAEVDASDKVRIGNTLVTSIGGEVDWTTFSDARYKTNIKEDVQGLAFINSLRPVTYTVDINNLNNHYSKVKKPITAVSDIKGGLDNFKESSSNLKPGVNEVKESEASKRSVEEASKIVQTGFLAQEVELAAQKLKYDFNGVDKPKTKDGLYGLRYSQFVVPLVKAVQELSVKDDNKDETIDKLQKRIDDLEEKLNKIELLLLQSGASHNAETSLKGETQIQNITLGGNSALLEQNIPNPFNHFTTIGYTLPQKFSSAQIVLTDKSGKVLKQVNISGAGKGIVNVDASSLASGAYYYSLYVDGKLIGGRQMVLAK